MRILIDVMGGDHLLQEIVRVRFRRQERLAIQANVVGAEDLIKAELDVRNAQNGSNIGVVNATKVITNNESQQLAVRKKKFDH